MERKLIKKYKYPEFYTVFHSGVDLICRVFATGYRLSINVVM